VYLILFSGLEVSCFCFFSLFQSLCLFLCLLFSLILFLVGPRVGGLDLCTALPSLHSPILQPTPSRCHPSDLLLPSSCVVLSRLSYFGEEPSKEERGYWLVHIFKKKNGIEWTICLVVQLFQPLLEEPFL